LPSGNSIPVHGPTPKAKNNIRPGAYITVATGPGVPWYPPHSNQSRPMATTMDDGTIVLMVHMGGKMVRISYSDDVRGHNSNHWHADDVCQHTKKGPYPGGSTWNPG